VQDLTSQRISESTGQDLYGLIGHPLRHSFSPAYFAEKFRREGIDAAYLAFPLEAINELPSLLASYPQLRGLNVTTPHKQSVMPYLDSISEDAKAIGALNCIAIKDGRLSGHNTDWVGFRDSLLPLLAPRYWPALILGNGGASHAVQYALMRLGIAYTVVSRRPAEGVIAYEALTPAMIEMHPLIVNTTTLGTLGEGLPALPYDAIGPGHLLYDLVYNPPMTPFLQEGASRGAVVKNGQEMLELQAMAAWNIWQHAH
jgi:shikimate dehydrogenase